MVPPIAVVAAVILDFRPRLGNHCRIFPRNTLQHAVILDLRGSIWESLQDFAKKRLHRAVILDFKPKLGNRCSAIAATVNNGPPAVCRGGCRRGQVAKKAA